LSECFSLGETGELIWKARPESHFISAAVQATVNKSKAFTPAGALDKRGFVRLKLGGKSFFAHNVVWKMVTGLDVPEDVILVHKNGNFADNRFENLRVSTVLQRNRAIRCGKPNTGPRDAKNRFCCAYEIPANDGQNH
jgi:hypothetical protein